MSGKVVQLDAFKTEDRQFQELVVKMMNGLFKRYDLLVKADAERKKEIEALAEKYNKMSELVLNMDDRLCRMSDTVIDDALRDI